MSIMKVEEWICLITAIKIVIIFKVNLCDFKAISFLSTGSKDTIDEVTLAIFAPQNAF